MVRIGAFLMTLLMASTVLANDPNFTTVPQRIELGEPAPALPLTPESPKEIRAEPRPLATVNFNYDQQGKRMRHAHLAPDGKSFRPCHDSNCRVPVPEKLELCPRCNWSVCQCAYQANGQTPNMPPIPSTQFRGQGGPHFGGGHCCQTQQAPTVQKKFLGGWLQVCKLRADGALSLPGKNCGCDECNNRTPQCTPRKVVVSGGLYLPFNLKPGITITR